MLAGLLVLGLMISQDTVEVFLLFIISFIFCNDCKLHTTFVFLKYNVNLTSYENKYF